MGSARADGGDGAGTIMESACAVYEGGGERHGEEYASKRGTRAIVTAFVYSWLYAETYGNTE